MLESKLNVLMLSVGECRYKTRGLLWQHVASVTADFNVCWTLGTFFSVISGKHTRHTLYLDMETRQ